ncbi:MAG: hypothetical protein ABSH32_02580 [Bryobacteraceae bacterium]
MSGSIRVARRAGYQLASMAAISHAMLAAANVGSKGLKPSIGGKVEILPTGVACGGLRSLRPAMAPGS